MSFAESSVKTFLENLASDSPAPGGGSASALAGALGAALCAMVARLTLGREKYRASWESMESLRDEADSLCVRFLNLMDLDSQAYNKVIEARRIPRGHEEERGKAMQSATKEAATVPLEMLRNLPRLADLAETAVEEGNPNCLSDVGVSAQLIRAAANGTAYNVRINLPGIEDRFFASELASETAQLLANVEISLEKVERILTDRFTPTLSSTSGETRG